MVALAADLLGVDTGGLIAVMAVGDQQLGVRERRLHRLDRGRIAAAPQAVHRAVVIGHLAPRRAGSGAGERAPGARGRVRVQREDRREVRPRGTRQSQPVLLGPGVRPLVRTDASRPVLLDSHARKESAPRPQRSVGPAVALLERPQRRLRVAHQNPRPLPLAVELRGVFVGLTARRQVDLDDVVRRARHELRALARIDHVIGRSHDVGQRARAGKVVMQRPQWLYVRHRRRGG